MTVSQYGKRNKRISMNFISKCSVLAAISLACITSQVSRAGGVELTEKLTTKAASLAPYQQRDFQEDARNDKLCFDCAGASGARVRPSRKAQKREKKGSADQFTVILDLRLF